MSDAAQHIKSSDKAEHESNANSTDGACLFHNEPKYKANSCSYRWQGTQQPRGDHTAIYENHPVASEKQRLAERGILGNALATMQYGTRKGGLYPVGSSYAANLQLPQQPGDWALGGPGAARASPAAAPSKAKRVIPPGANFTTAFWPYWNNAHHLIPKATFTEQVGLIQDMEVRHLVAVGLYLAKYNINHYTNVIFLPMDAEVGKMLQLPRHLTLAGSAKVKTGADYADHEAYTAKVVEGLMPVLKSYKREAEAARGDPPKPCEAVKMSKLSKEMMQDVSEQCFKRIVEFGGQCAGASLNDIGHISF